MVTKVKRMKRIRHCLICCFFLSLLFIGCARKDDPIGSEEQENMIDSSSSEETSEDISMNVQEESATEWSPGVYVIHNGDEIQNGPNQKGVNPLLATLIFYEDGTFYFDFDTGLSVGGFSGNYEVMDDRITAISDTSAYPGNVHLIFTIQDEDTLIFVEDQGENQHYFVNKSKQLQLVEEGDPFVRSGETIEETETR